MRKLSLSEWAAIGEIIGTLAVVVSLVFVVFSLNQNTAAIHGSTENIIFERHTDLANQFMLDPSLAEILVKMRGADPQLSDIEAVRWEGLKYGFDPTFWQHVGKSLYPTTK